MTDPQGSHHEHIEFDVLCASVEDYEPLPEVMPDSGHTPNRPSERDRLETIDEEILAGLVSP